MTDAIAVENLSKRYRLGQLSRATMLREALAGLLARARARADQTIWALDDVSFRVAEGEVVGIIGRNGAGKSTLLKILSRITYPTSGSVRVRGRVASLLEVGTGFHEELTGRENIYLNGSILGMKKREIDARLDQIIEFAGTEKFIDTPMKRYSSGMRLRLGFAVAAHLDPDMLLVDEVLAVGDAGFQRKCLNRMSDLHSTGRTVLFVSHNMAAVENLCPRTLWIENGRLRMDGESRRVIEAYLGTFASRDGQGIDWDRIETREGSGAARFTGLEYLTPEGDPKPVIQSGDSLLVRLHFDSKERLPSPTFGFKIATNMGTLVTNLNTWGTGYDIPSLPPGRGFIDLKIEFLNLMPGRYYVSLWLSSPGPIVYDRIQNCAVLDVEASDYYGSGKGVDSRLGVIFLPCSWALRAPPPDTAAGDRAPRGS